MPERIQRKRTKGWRMPEGAVYVGRPSRWGNPFGGDAVQAVLAFREFLISGLEDRPSRTGHAAAALDGADGYPHRRRLVAALPALRGRDLVCWCPLDVPCHADVLLEIANAADLHPEGEAT